MTKSGGIFFTWENNCSGGGSIPTLCAPVENLAANVVNTTVNLTWDAPLTATPDSYDVYRETVFLGNTTETSFVDEGAAEGIYDYCVYAVYTDCQSSFECVNVVIGDYEPLLGDANGDGVVNVVDITAIVVYIMEQNPQPFVIGNADANSDGTVDVLDIISIVGIIMDK